ncbi:MAG: PqqD family peptide modification chaperone [Desulfofustis sp.]|nr:PqqD family peptide modification chaperone [Desulfofustis sp.]
MSLYSSYWYRVEQIRPQVPPHTRLYRHIYRGQTWYVLQDPSSNRQHRFNKTAYFLISQMNGERTVAEIWEHANEVLADDAPTQDEIIQLLGELHSADVMQSDIPPDTAELFQRQEKHRGKWKHRFSNPFALRFPLIDPDDFLTRWVHLVQPVISWLGLIVWLFVVGLACVLAMLNWPELTENIADRILRPENLLILWLVYPVVKLLHELAHAFATKIWGGEVHEMGIMLLALTPIPYVEASSSATFPDKRRRMAVAAAGMGMELLVASLALFLWLNIESGQISTIAYNVMLIGGVSTLLFNGNPLLRFDGYYILADWIEIPNLAQRSTRYLGYLLQRYVFGIKEARSPVTAKGERPWFVTYGIASFCYRMFVLAALALFVSSKFFVVGVLIALWALFTQILLPAVRNSVRLYSSIGGRQHRKRFIFATAALTGTAAALLFVVPMPLKTLAQGVVSLPEQSRLRAGTDCFITDVVRSNGSKVEAGEVLIKCEDPYLSAELRVLEANLEEAQAKYNSEPMQSRAKREILRKDLDSVKAELQRTQERVGELVMRSPDSGIFILPEEDNLQGRFVTKGALLGYIMGAAQSTVIVVVEQSDINLVRENTTQVELRLIGNLDRLHKTRIDRQVPAASDRLPSAVLGTAGGGTIPVSPEDPDGLQTLQKTFQFEFRLPLEQQSVRIGERVFALFDHGYEPIALQLFRSVRQLFLRRFHV